ncbi:MAG: hypothetical protein P0Y48_09950 [Candidatus Microbacterium phytovorans]|uniref:Uncharacterized protein n=1 Tax=Candidatus Microbacterium phytovorans TaxID=3121374 RepID=A0AAJ5W038_9MICO|nr:hypothetical protein [Microbacterium sp.]WEK12788.1 MAG: hypothetical protein P0Y48_09950 [Microbacterium sp.]
MTETWMLGPFVMPDPWNPYLDHTPPPISDIDGPAPPVIRIPIAGPDPFNTLAIVRGRSFISHGPISDGKLDRGVRRLIPTHLTIPGFDPERPVSEQVRHSSVASIVTISSGGQRNPENDAGSDFIIAVDALDPDPTIDRNGRYYLTAVTASSHDQTSSGDFLEMTSWVAYYDPAMTLPPEPIEIRRLDHLEVRTKRRFPDR